MSAPPTIIVTKNYPAAAKVGTLGELRGIEPLAIKPVDIRLKGYT